MQPHLLGLQLGNSNGNESRQVSRKRTLETNETNGHGHVIFCCWMWPVVLLMVFFVFFLFRLLLFVLALPFKNEFSMLHTTMPTAKATSRDTYSLIRLVGFFASASVRHFVRVWFHVSVCVWLFVCCCWGLHNCLFDVCRSAENFISVLTPTAEPEPKHDAWSVYLLSHICICIFTYKNATLLCELSASFAWVFHVPTHNFLLLHLCRCRRCCCYRRAKRKL